MRFPLWLRLFIAFAVLSITGLLVLTLVQRRTFQNDFLAYVNQQATTRVESAALEIGKRYEVIGDWSFLIARPRLFEAYVDGSFRAFEAAQEMEPIAREPFRGDRRGPPEEARDDRPPRRGPPPRDGPPPREGPPLKDGPDSRGGPPAGFDRLEDRGRMPKGPQDGPPDGPTRTPLKGPKGAERRLPLTRIDALNVQTRLALKDDRGNHVIGNPGVPPDSPGIAVRANGVVVGKLLIAPQPALESDIDVAFVRSQLQHALMAALGVLLVALAAGLLLARWLLAPVKTLGAHMQKLAAGDLRERIETTRNDELGDLARNYNRLADILARNQEARRTWGADIAHELRTPLSILRGEIQAMQDGIRPLSQDALASLQAECSRLTGLVEDLYQLALSDSGALEYRFETIDLNALARDAESEFAGSLKDAGITLTLVAAATPLPVRADARRMMQLLSNLLTNSRRYTDAPGEVRMTLAAINDVATLIIDDSPPGVAPELLPKLFERLFRVEGSRNRAAGGAGLGLAICKNIADAHGGTLVASASPLGGVRMTLSIALSAN